MKKITILLFAILLTHTTYAQVEIYSRYTPSKKTIEPDINIFGTKKISQKVNLTYFALIEEKWSEALVGFSYAPKDWYSIGVSAGIEHNPAIYRLGGSIWFGKGKTSLLMLGEKGDGTTNYWYKSILAYDASAKITLGAIAWRFHGVGPVVKYHFIKSGTTLWCMPAYDFEAKQTRIMFGYNVKI